MMIKTPAETTNKIASELITSFIPETIPEQIIKNPKINPASFENLVIWYVISFIKLTATDLRDRVRKFTELATQKQGGFPPYFAPFWP